MNRRRLRGMVVGMTVGAVLLTAAPAAVAAPEADRRHDRHHARTQQAMDAVVVAGVPGVLGQVRDGRGVWTGSSGVADVRTERPRVRPDRFRIGSITKTFVATVLLRLQEEGRLDLDDSVERWLPGLVRGHGHDGREITVRQLLNHTSGVFNYTEDPELAERMFGLGFFEHRYDTFTPEELVAIAMEHEPVFAPGEGWSYSNTNYVLAGLVIEAVTGKPYADEVERRVIEPLGLRSTVVPGTRARMPRPHGRGYGLLPEGEGVKLVDVTDVNPSVAGAAGEMVSTVDDLNRFLRALLDGRLLSEKSMAEMFATVPTGGEGSARYGLGVLNVDLSCGVGLWGHDGSIHGSLSSVFSTRNGDHTMAFNANATWGPLGSVLEAEFCGTAPEEGEDSRTSEGFETFELPGRSEAPRSSRPVPNVR